MVEYMNLLYGDKRRDRLTDKQTDRVGEDMSEKYVREITGEREGGGVNSHRQV